VVRRSVFAHVFRMIGFRCRSRASLDQPVDIAQPDVLALTPSSADVQEAWPAARSRRSTRSLHVSYSCPLQKRVLHGAPTIAVPAGHRWKTVCSSCSRADCVPTGKAVVGLDVFEVDLLPKVVRRADQIASFQDRCGSSRFETVDIVRTLNGRLCPPHAAGRKRADVHAQGLAVPFGRQTPTRVRAGG